MRNLEFYKVNGNWVHLVERPDEKNPCLHVDGKKSEKYKTITEFLEEESGDIRPTV